MFKTAVGARLRTLALPAVVHHIAAHIREFDGRALAVRDLAAKVQPLFHRKIDILDHLAQANHDFLVLALFSVQVAYLPFAADDILAFGQAPDAIIAVAVGVGLVAAAVPADDDDILERFTRIDIIGTPRHGTPQPNGNLETRQRLPLFHGYFGGGLDQDVFIVANRRTVDAGPHPRHGERAVRSALRLRIQVIQGVIGGEQANIDIRHRLVVVDVDDGPGYRGAALEGHRQVLGPHFGEIRNARHVVRGAHNEGPGPRTEIPDGELPGLVRDAIGTGGGIRVAVRSFGAVPVGTEPCLCHRLSGCADDPPRDHAGRIDLDPLIRRRFVVRKLKP